MDAREDWALRAELMIGELLSMNVLTEQDKAAYELADKRLSAHLRETPKGYVLVPVDLLEDAKDVLIASTTREKGRVLRILIALLRQHEANPTASQSR